MNFGFKESIKSLQVAAVICLAVYALLSSGCSRPLDEELHNTISLALSLKNAGEVPSVCTKMTATITQDGSGFRGIDQVYMIPFRMESAGPVVGGSSRLGGSNVKLLNPGIRPNGLVANNNSHLYNLAEVPKQTNRILAYGKSSDEGSTATKQGRHKNGMLVPLGLDNPEVTEDISFSLETILEADDIYEMEQTADNLITALNGVVEALQTAEDPTFQSFLDVFAAENQIAACSYQTVYRLEQSILGELSQYSGTDSYGINAIMSRLSVLQAARNAAGSDFPSFYGIPEGSIGMWWNGHRFVRLFNGVNLSLVPVGEYAYPPGLWYYANSAIKTSTDDNVRNQYKPENSTWGNILSYYTEGTSVTSSTRSAAMVDQMQYGVGLVELRFVAPDAEAATAKDCPLTGVIIEGQKEVDYSFAPKSSATRFIYDNTISGITLGGTSQYVQVLVLPTADDRTVHFALEFRNITSSSFSCQQGVVRPGCNFYLAGELKPGEGTKPSQEQINSVFSRDYKTTVYIRVNKLENAYNTVPDLRDPQLEIGVVADMDWMQVEPGGVKLPFD